ncbi:transposase [Streptomyces sp. 769]|nr:transposase [Streptomyces sp. 769]
MPGTDRTRTRGRSGSRPPAGSVHGLPVEGEFAHLHWFRRLRIRWEIRDGIHRAFLTLDVRLPMRRTLRGSCRA